MPQATFRLGELHTETFSPDPDWALSRQDDNATARWPDFSTNSSAQREDLRRARRLAPKLTQSSFRFVRRLFNGRTIFLSPEPEQSVVQLILFHLPHAPTPLPGLDIICRSQSSSHAR